MCPFLSLGSLRGRNSSPDGTCGEILRCCHPTGSWLPRSSSTKTARLKERRKGKAELTIRNFQSSSFAPPLCPQLLNALFPTENQRGMNSCRSTERAHRAVHQPQPRQSCQSWYRKLKPFSVVTQRQGVPWEAHTAPSLVESRRVRVRRGHKAPLIPPLPWAGHPPLPQAVPSSSPALSPVNLPFSALPKPPCVHDGHEAAPWAAGTCLRHNYLPGVVCDGDKHLPARGFGVVVPGWAGQGHGAIPRLVPSSAAGAWGLRRGLEDRHVSNT